MGNTEKKLTQLLKAAGRGEEDALAKAIPKVHAKLREIAGRQMRKERSDHTLQPTALVNEVYLRFLDQNEIVLQDRNHFFAIAAILMRQILVNHAKAKNAQKRGGKMVPVQFNEKFHGGHMNDSQILALDDALKLLAKEDPRRAQVVELRYFGGLDIEETAEVLSTSPATVKRDWTVAKAWLFRELSKGNK